MHDWDNSFIYCDAAPKFGAGGFSAVLGAIFHPKLKPLNLTLISSLKKRDSTTGNTVFLNLLSYRGLRLHWIIRLILLLHDLVKIIFSSKLNIHMHKKEMCVWIGSDWSAIFRGFFVARKLQCSCVSVYIVDDIYITLNLKNTFENKIKRIFIRYLLSKYNFHFAITEHLATHLSKMSGFSWSILDLPYRLDELVDVCMPESVINTNTDDIKKSIKIVFVGTLAPAILPVLGKLCELLIDIKYELDRGATLSLHVVSNDIRLLSSDVFRTTIELGLLQIYKDLSDDEIIRQFNIDSIFMCPYSSAIATKDIVSNSFPSKLLKMVLYGQHVLIVAPDYAAVLSSHGSYFTSISEDGLIGFVKNPINIFYSKKPYTIRELLNRHSITSYFNTLKKRSQVDGFQKN